ncbi:unnamed protein product [Meloidogyne enterolobii]|uniref:Uncharacterized protein n=1 Tax=Meloidogyne enterolobii TaxID=390850 RepID=A0ACB1AHJ5_MELEN
MSKLRFFLGTKFDKLLREEKLKENYEYFSIPLNIKKFDDSLKERLNVLSEYVQEKEKIEKDGDEKSFLKLLFDTEVLNINTLNEKPLAILDKVDKGKNIEIPFDLFFCDFNKQMKYGAVILNKKDFNENLFKGSEYSVNPRNLLELKDLDELIRKSSFLSQKIRNRYHQTSILIRLAMKVEENNFKNSLTRTGKVYKIMPIGRINCDNTIEIENIYVKIFETEKTIQIESETPMAIVELIEEVKIEREENKEAERKQMLEKYDDFIVELKEEWFKALFNHLIDNRIIYIKDKEKKVTIKLSKEKKAEKEEKKEKEEEKEEKKEEEKGSRNGKRKGIKKYIIDKVKKLFKKEEKGEASTSNKVETIHDKQDEHILYFDKNSVIRKTFLLKIYGKENAVKLVKGKKDSAIFVNIADETYEVNKNKINIGKFFEIREFCTVIMSPRVILSSTLPLVQISPK